MVKLIHFINILLNLREIIRVGGLFYLKRYQVFQKKDEAIT